MGEIKEWIRLRQSHLEQALSRRQHLQESLAEQNRCLDRLQEDLQHARQALLLLQQLSQAVQEKVHHRIAEVVSSCLSAVFDEPYEFKIQFERKRGRTEACLRFVRGSLEVDPLSASGGGMVDVAAFALRAAALMLHRPPLSRMVVLDEPFRFVSEEFQPRIRIMLEQLAEKLGLQVIMVTHNPVYATGKVIRLR